MFILPLFFSFPHGSPCLSSFYTSKALMVKESLNRLNGGLNVMPESQQCCSPGFHHCSVVLVFFCFVFFSLLEKHIYRFYHYFALYIMLTGQWTYGFLRIMKFHWLFFLHTPFLVLELVFVPHILQKQNNTAFWCPVYQLLRKRSSNQW